jgi:hypothetical protein
MAKSNFSFVPSPVSFDYDAIYSAVSNESGRMQYYVLEKGNKRQRINRKSFTDVYNNSKIIAVRPIQDEHGLGIVQMDVFIKH